VVTEVREEERILMMTRLDRVLLAFLGIGVWVLIAVTLGSTKVQGDTQELTEYDVRRIVENCTVTGEVYLYSEDYGEIDGASISC